MPWTLDDFDYPLPEDLIAQHPPAQRGASRLLDGSGPTPVDRQFADWPGLLHPGDLVVFNNTRVIKARLRGQKPSGGAVEVLVERVLPPPAVHEVWAHVRASKSPTVGSRFHLAGAFEAEVLGRCGPEGSLFHLRWPADPLALMDAHGHVPLPPYITHADGAEDEARYQSVFAQHPGAVAAPTASLHITEATLAALVERGVQTTEVTLHVGAGTFQPVRTANLAEHRMHSEWYEVGPEAAAAVAAARSRGARVVAVGTTALRALESAALSGAAPARPGAGPCAMLPVGQGDTTLFITPGFQFQVVDALLTNFHLPKSTLMMLVSALAGHRHVMDMYRHAVAQRYRFFSYGDCMWLTRSTASAHPDPGPNL